MWAQGIHPSNAELRGRDAFLVGDRFEFIDELQVMLKVLQKRDGHIIESDSIQKTDLWLEPRQVSAYISLCDT